MSDSVLAVDKLCKSFGGVKAVVDVSFELQRGVYATALLQELIDQSRPERQ